MPRDLFARMPRCRILRRREKRTAVALDASRIDGCHARDQERGNSRRRGRDRSRSRTTRDREGKGEDVVVTLDAGSSSSRCSADDSRRALLQLSRHLTVVVALTLVAEAAVSAALHSPSFDDEQLMPLLMQMLMHSLMLMLQCHPQSRPQSQSSLAASVSEERRVRDQVKRRAMRRRRERGDEMRSRAVASTETCLS